MGRDLPATMVCVMQKRPDTTAWARGYRAALRAWLKRNPESGLSPALRIGRRAVGLGLEPLELARIHDRALATLLPPESAPGIRRSMANRARTFFAAAIVPIESSHPAGRTALARIRRLTQTLRKRTAESSVSSSRLKRSHARRRAAETVLKRHRTHRVRMLRAEHGRQARLRERMRSILTVAERQRKRSSLQISNEVAQALLAIQIRLLALMKVAGSGAAHFNKELADTQGLVKTSAEKVHRLVHEASVQNRA
jgi:hypothetical protein